MNNRELVITDLAPGKYVAAVSGGVDSMALLHMLQKRPGVDLVVAHLDHGIREDSAEDRELVQEYCASHNIKFVYEEAHLGQNASEESARQARYNFLRHACANFKARAIITAHHQDDLLETAIINIIRGTGRRGLSALANHDRLMRPLLHVGKAEILAYARAHGLVWREDSTNLDQKYLRNYVRHQIAARLSEEQRKNLLSIIVRHSALNSEINRELDGWLSEHVELLPGTYSDPDMAGFPTVSVKKESFITGFPVEPGMTSEQPRGYLSAIVSRYDFIMLPQTVAYELLQQLFKNLTGTTLEKPLAERALLFIKTARPHKQFLLGKDWQLKSEPRRVIVEVRGNVVNL